MVLEALADLGLSTMTDEEIRGFLASQRIGVLGMSDDDGPYLIPVSYGFDGEDRLYFTFVLSEGSRKLSLLERSAGVRFLVYTVDSPFTWESVMVAGDLERLDPEAVDDVREYLDEAWRPAVLEEAWAAFDVGVFELHRRAWSGVRHVGLPPTFDG